MEGLQEHLERPEEAQGNRAEERRGNLAQEIQMVVGSCPGGNRPGWCIQPVIAVVAREDQMVLGVEGQHLGEAFQGVGYQRCMVKDLVQGVRNHQVRLGEVRQRAFFP